MRQIAKVLWFLIGFLPTLAAAQIPPSMQPNTVIGRGAFPSNGGPPQSIPFAQLFAGAGVVAGPQSCSTHNWFNTLNAGGVLGCSQPSFADISGTIAATQLPTPGASSLGGVQSKDCSSGGQFVQKINTDGTESCATPAGGGNVSNTGTPTAGQFALWTNSSTIQGVSPAAKSDQQTGTSTTAAVTPSQQQSHPSALKAVGYATLSGTTLTDHSPYNASISRTGVGAYTISFTPTPFANTNYSCTITPTATSAATVFVAEMVGSKSVGSMNFAVAQATAFGAADPTAIDVHCAGSQ